MEGGMKRRNEVEGGCGSWEAERRKGGREEEGKEAGKKNLDEFTSVTKINLKWIKTYM